MSDQTDPGVIEWFFRGLSVAMSLLAAGFAYILRTNATKLRAIDIRQDATDKLVQESRLDIKNAEISVKNLQIHVTENFCNKGEIQTSLARVHDKIEDGNRKTEELGERMADKVDNLRKEISADIRSAMQVALHQVPPVT